MLLASKVIKLIKKKLVFKRHKPISEMVHSKKDSTMSSKDRVILMSLSNKYLSSINVIIL